MKSLFHTLNKLVAFYLLLLLWPATVIAGIFPAEEWVDRLSKRKGTDHSQVKALELVFSKMDSTEVEKTLTQIEKEGSSAGPIFQLRLLHARIWFLQDRNQPYGMEKLVPLLESMMAKASATNDEELIAYASWVYGSMMYSYNELEPAVTYSLKALDIYGRIKPFAGLHFYYSYLGEMLFHTYEYPKSIRYTRKALELNTDTAAINLQLRIKDLNTIGQCYQQLALRDSALFFFQASGRLADSIGHEVWKGINASYIGQCYFSREQYPAAKNLFWLAYGSTWQKEPPVAANTLQWLAKLHLLQGRTDSAAICLKQALHLLDSYGHFNPLQVAIYRRAVYAVKTELFSQLKQADSLNFYQRRYNTLHDSLQRIAILSSSKVALLRIDNEKNQYLLQAVMAEKKQEALKRNFLLIGISLLAIIVILVLNRQKKKLQYQKVIGSIEKSRLKAEVLASREKLDLYTQTLLEKSSLLEQLQRELQEKELNSSQLDLVSELTSVTILTEEDWNKFRSMFEKVYPGFFYKLKQQNRDITLAEQRMAALTRLGLATRQMAAMLGISADGVHKTRQRLRNRLQLDTDTNLESFLANIDA